MFEPRSGDGWRDPFTMYADLRDHDPVHHVEPTHSQGDYWVLSRFGDVFRAARDPATFSSAQGLTFTYDERSQAGLDEVSPMVFLDPPDHTAFRRLVAAGFTPRTWPRSSRRSGSSSSSASSALVAAGGGDIVAELFKPLPSFVVAHYLGVPPEDRGRFDGWTDGDRRRQRARRPAPRGRDGGGAVRLLR